MATKRKAPERSVWLFKMRKDLEAMGVFVYFCDNHFTSDNASKLNLEPEGLYKLMGKAIQAKRHTLSYERFLEAFTAFLEMFVTVEDGHVTKPCRFKLTELMEVDSFMRKRGLTSCQVDEVLDKMIKA